MIMFLCCLQTEEQLLKTHLEKLAFLTKKNNRVDEKDVYAKLGDNVSLKLKLSLSAYASMVLLNITFLQWFFFQLTEGRMHQTCITG